MSYACTWFILVEDVILLAAYYFDSDICSPYDLKLYQSLLLFVNKNNLNINSVVRVGDFLSHNYDGLTREVKLTHEYAEDVIKFSSAMNHGKNIYIVLFESIDQNIFAQIKKHLECNFKSSFISATEVKYINGVKDKYSLPHFLSIHNDQVELQMEGEESTGFNGSIINMIKNIGFRTLVRY